MQTQALNLKQQMMKSVNIEIKRTEGYFVNDIDLATVLSIKKEEYLVELKVIIDNAINDGLNIEDIKDIVDKVLEEKNL